MSRSLSENIYGRKTGGDKSRYNIWLRCPVGKIDTNSPPLKNTVGENSILNFLHSVFRQTPRSTIIKRLVLAVVLVAIASVPVYGAASGPTIDRTSVLITVRKIDCAYPGGQRDESQYSWKPIMNFTINGPIASGTVFTVEYFLPGNTPWISFDRTSQKLDTNAWYSYDRAGKEVGDPQGTTVTGSIAFTISMRNEQDGTPRTTLFAGTFTVKKYNFSGYPEDLNKFDYYVDHDWRLPIAVLWGNWVEPMSGKNFENKTPDLWLKAWFHGDRRLNTRAVLYYQGVEITWADGKVDEAALTAEKSIRNWISFQYELPALWYNKSDNPAASPWFDMSKNPGDYQIKIFVNEEIARVIDFKIGTDGRVVDNGYAKQANLKYRWIFPAKIFPSAEGTVNKEAYKTDAFYGNPLSGFTVP